MENKANEMKESFRVRSEEQGHVNVPMGRLQISGKTISTEGLTGCYVFLLSGLFLGLPFCYMDHHSYFVESDTSTASSVLLDLMRALVLSIIKEMKKFNVSVTVSSLISSLSLLIGGGIQDGSDAIRDAFALLQTDGDLMLAIDGSSARDGDQRNLLKQLHRNVIIINPVSYLLSDDLEDFAAEAGLLEDDLIQPVSVWINFDCHTKKGDLGVLWKSPRGELDLALMEMTFRSNNPDHNVWQLQWKEITAFRSSFEDDCYRHLALDVDLFTTDPGAFSNKRYRGLAAYNDEPQMNIFQEAIGYVQRAVDESRSTSAAHGSMASSRSEEATTVRRRHSSPETQAAASAKKQRSSSSTLTAREDPESNDDGEPNDI